MATRSTTVSFNFRPIFRPPFPLGARRGPRILSNNKQAGACHGGPRRRRGERKHRSLRRRGTGCPARARCSQDGAANAPEGGRGEGRFQLCLMAASGEIKKIASRLDTSPGSARDHAGGAVQWRNGCAPCALPCERMWRSFRTTGAFFYILNLTYFVVTRGRHGTGRGALEPRFLHAGRVLPMAEGCVWFLSAGGLERVPRGTMTKNTVLSVWFREKLNLCS